MIDELFVLFCATEDTYNVTSDMNDDYDNTKFIPVVSTVSKTKSIVV